MTDEEITNLTLAMANSGEVIDLSSIEGIKVESIRLAVLVIRH